MKKIKPSHPVEFLIEEFGWNQYKAQLLIGNGVNESNIKELCDKTGWHEHMWKGLQEQYDSEMERDRREGIEWKN